MTAHMLFYQDEFNTESFKIKSQVKNKFADFTHFNMMKLADRAFKEQLLRKG